MGSEDHASRRSGPRRGLSHTCQLYHNQVSASATIRKKNRLAITSQPNDVELRVVEVEASAQLRGVG